SRHAQDRVIVAPGRRRGGAVLAQASVRDRLMRVALLACALSSFGCATIVNEANGRLARIDVTSAGFARAVFSEGELVEQRRAGDCRLLDRSRFHAPDPPNIPAGMQPVPNSGPIRVAASGDAVVLTPLYHGFYRESERRLQPLWQAGETIVVSAPGATAPPFQVELPAPQPIWTVEPPIQDANEYGPTFWALRDLPVRWSPVAHATLVLQLFEAHPEAGTDRAHVREGTRRIRCEFDGARGEAVVPQELIAELPIGNAVLYVSSMTERSG